MCFRPSVAEMHEKFKDDELLKELYPAHAENSTNKRTVDILGVIAYRLGKQNDILEEIADYLGKKG